MDPGLGLSLESTFLVVFLGLPHLAVTSSATWHPFTYTSVLGPILGTVHREGD